MKPLWPHADDERGHTLTAQRHLRTCMPHKCSECRCCLADKHALCSLHQGHLVQRTNQAHTNWPCNCSPPFDHHLTPSESHVAPHTCKRITKCIYMRIRWGVLNTRLRAVRWGAGPAAGRSSGPRPSRHMALVCSRWGVPGSSGRARPGSAASKHRAQAQRRRPGALMHAGVNQ